MGLGGVIVTAATNDGLYKSGVTNGFYIGRPRVLARVENCRWRAHPSAAGPTRLACTRAAQTPCSAHGCVVVSLARGSQHALSAPFNTEHHRTHHPCTSLTATAATPPCARRTLQGWASSTFPAGLTLFVTLMLLVDDVCRERLSRNKKAGSDNSSCRWAMHTRPQRSPTTSRNLLKRSGHKPR